MNTLAKKILVAASAILVVSVAYSSFAGQATVVDEASGKPIAGAQVLVFWSARRVKIVEGGDSLCWGLTATTSDANGQFDVPSFSWNINPLNYHRGRNVVLAARGYTYSTKSDYDNLKFLLRPLADPKLDPYEAKKDFTLVAENAVGSDCGDVKLSLPYLKGNYQNLELLTTNNEEEVKLFDMYYRIQIVEFGPNEARQSARQKWIEDRSQIRAKERTK